VLVAFGRYPAFEGRLPQLGTDFAGVVTAVGPEVTDHKVGDHVGGLCADGCWGTFITCDARLAVTLPAGLSDEQAAAVTTAHATAWYGLNELARIKAGDRVLIHSATGGVGQAAIAIARAARADIFATAGSEQRRQLLRDMSIEPSRAIRQLAPADRVGDFATQCLIAQPVKKFQKRQPQIGLHRRRRPTQPRIEGRRKRREKRRVI
jgi:polyketide synthase 5